MIHLDILRHGSKRDIVMVSKSMLVEGWLVVFHIGLYSIMYINRP